MGNKLETEKTCSKCKFYGETCLKTGAPTQPFLYGCKFWKEPSEPHLSKDNALVQVMFYMAGTIDLYAIWLEKLFNAQGRTFKHEMKRHFTGMSKAIKDLHYHADQLDIVVGDLSNAVEACDNRLLGSLELARLLLLYYDKCAFDDDNQNEVFKKLRSMDGEGMFTEEDLKRFYIKK